MRPISLLELVSACRPGVLVGLAAAALAALGSAQGTLGVSGSFARLQPTRAKTFIKSSSDPDERPFSAVMGNDDGFSGLNAVEAFRYQSGFDELSVLADIQGRAGYMGLFFRNFWSGVAGLPILLQERNRAQILADNQLLHDRLLPDYFRNTTHPGGQIAPFDGPFTAGRAGGFLTHTPITWQDQFRVQVYENAFENSGRFHKVAGTLMSPERLVEVPDKAAWEQVYSRIGGWRHSVPRNATTTRLALPGPDAPAKVRLGGPGAILELRARLADPSLWDDIWVRMRWDGMDEHYVEAPLRFFGGMVRRPHAAPMDTLFVGNDGQEIWCYLPMPFDEAAELEFVNQGASGTSLDLTLATWQGQYPTPWGYFSAHYDQEVTRLGVPFQGPKLENVRGMMRGLFLEDFVDTSGRILHVDLMHLEGDLCIRINGNRGDDHNFAATETSVGKWGWYGTQSDVFFAGDTSFNTGMMPLVRPNYVIEIERIQGSTYVFDPVQFADGIEIRLEHGVQNLANAEYGLFSFFYLQPGAARETIQTIDVGDVAAETAANVQFGTAPRFVLTSSFFRDAFFETEPLHDDGRDVRDFYRFDVQSPQLRRYRGVGVGFRLDRPKIGDGGLCQARLFVDGVYAGLLHSYSSNALNRWKEGGELEVELPRSLTDGKSQFTVEVRPVSGTAPLRIGEVTVHGYLRD
jgi:hypothetical protein